MDHPYDKTHWTLQGRDILAPETMAILRKCSENGPIIVEHGYDYGGCSPDRTVLDDFDDFSDDLRGRSRPGDALHVWDFASLCRDDNGIANGKYPDADGRVPERGAC